MKIILITISVCAWSIFAGQLALLLGLDYWFQGYCSGAVAMTVYFCLIYIRGEKEKDEQPI